jgi:hypothetical protein
VSARLVDAAGRISLEGDAVGDARVVLLASEPYSFREVHVAELRELMPKRAVALIDGEMTGWYGSRAIAALGYLLRFRKQLASPT